MAKILHLLQDEAYLWFDMKPVDDILENGPSSYAKIIGISDEEFARYQRHLEEQKYWQSFFESA